MVECYTCHNNFKNEDGLYVGISSFICFNCLKKKINQKVTPIKKKWWHFLSVILFLLLLPQLRADEVNLTGINMVAPSFFNYSYIFGNTTYIYPINCTYDYGNCSNVTYVENVTISGCDQLKNKTVKLTFDMRIDESYINITYINGNSTRIFPNTGTYNLLDDYYLDCQYLVNETITDEECGDRTWVPINISQDQWYWYCLEPFGEYGETITRLSNMTTDFQRKLITDNLDLSGQLTACKEEKAKLDVMRGAYERSAYETELYQQQIKFLNANNTAMLKEIEDIKISKSTRNTISWILLCFNITISLGWIMWYLFWKITGLRTEREA